MFRASLQQQSDLEALRITFRLKLGRYWRDKVLRIMAKKIKGYQPLAQVLAMSWILAKLIGQVTLLLLLLYQ